METKVTFIYDYKQIELPPGLMELVLPDMEAFVDFQCQSLAEKHSSIQLAEGQAHVLTDDMIKKEDLPGIETVEAYRQALMREVPRVILAEQTQMILMNSLVPQLVQRSTFEIDDEEATRESQKRLEVFEANAREKDLTLLEAGRQEFGLPDMDEGQIRQYVLTLARTNFLFRVLAHEYLRRQGKTFDLASYSGYIKDLSEAAGMSDQEVRDLVPPHIYMEEVPVLVMLDEMTAWLEPQIKVKSAEDDPPAAE